MYAELDKDTHQLVVTLPPELKPYFNELNNDLMDEFAYDLMSKQTLERINHYIVNWFGSKGIELKEPEEPKKEGESLFPGT